MNQPSSLTFSAFASISIDRRILTEGTTQGYLRLLDHATPTLGCHQIGAISRGHVQECLADCRDKLSPSTAQNVLKLIRSILRDAGSTAADNITVPVHEPSIRVLDASEVSTLRTYLAALETPTAYALLVLMGTGLRRSELLNLTVDDWRSGSRQLHVARSKSRRVRDVDVPDSLCEVLEKAVSDRMKQDSVTPHFESLKKARVNFQSRAETSGPLFAISKDTLRRALNSACEAVGLPHIRIHALRHTRITYLLIRGVTPLYVSQQAGHSSPAFTLSRYGHLVAASTEQRRSWCNA
jgi:integrase